jgi:diguanylate cyclase (GGDEF)-like protein
VDPQATVLVVDDLEANRSLLRDMLEDAGHRVVEAGGGEEAIAKAVAERPETILLDVKMPAMDGFEVCRRLKALAETSSIPVVFVTANFSEDEDRLHGLELGAYDYLIKPIPMSLLLARVAVMLRIRRAEDRIRQLSMVDEFTGLYSKKYVLHRLDEETERAERHGGTLMVAMIDLDDFKHCNDHYGHQFGDRVLQGVAAVFKTNVRLYDSVGRYGGEEFLLLQPEVRADEAMSTIERLKEKLAEQSFPVNGTDVRVTFSAGLAVWEPAVTAEDLLGRADSALYTAKRSGKNRTIRYSDPISAAATGSAGSDGVLATAIAARGSTR